MSSYPTLLHRARDGKLRLLKRCILPIAAPGVLKLVTTDLGQFEVTPKGFYCRSTLQVECLRR